jgi:hypothetical protein
MKNPIYLSLLVLTGCVQPIDVYLEKPAQGFQYTVPGYTVEKSTETQRCFFYEIPSDEPVYVNKFEIAQNPGSHHMNVFRVKTVKALIGANGESVIDGECWKSGNWSDWPLVVNSQESNSGKATVWQLPEGTAMRFEPHELVMLQSHYVNASTQETPKEAKVFVNFHTVAESTQPVEVGTLFATNQSIKICPGDSNKYFETTCRMSQSTPLTIIGANGHFHSRGRQFDISTFDPSETAPAEPFYSSTEWADPPMKFGLDVAVPAGGGVRYRCTYTAPADSCGDIDNACCFSFGGKVESQEHCNAFVYYYPKVKDVGCF